MTTWLTNTEIGVRAGLRPNYTIELIRVLPAERKQAPNPLYIAGSNNGQRSQIFLVNWEDFQAKRAEVPFGKLNVARRAGRIPVKKSLVVLRGDDDAEEVDDADDVLHFWRSIEGASVTKRAANTLYRMLSGRYPGREAQAAYDRYPAVMYEALVAHGCMTRWRQDLGPIEQHMATMQSGIGRLDEGQTYGLGGER